jgi:prevent-host-death family protein
MKTASIRELKHDTSTVLGWVAEGEQVRIERRGKPVAVLGPPPRPKARTKRPDFAARLKSIYGDRVLAQTATELLGEERGDR